MCDFPPYFIYVFFSFLFVIPLSSSLFVGPNLRRQSVAAGADSLGTYIRSREGQDVAASTVLVIGALAGAASSVANAFKTAKKEFEENALPG